MEGKGYLALINGVVVVLGIFLVIRVAFSVLVHVGDFICRRSQSEANAKRGETRLCSHAVLCMRGRGWL